MKYQHETVWPKDPRYADLLALFGPLAKASGPIVGIRFTPAA